MFKNPKKKSKDEPENTHREHGEQDQETSGHLPYTKGLTELQKIFKPYGVATYHKPSNTLRQVLMHPKITRKSSSVE